MLAWGIAAMLCLALVCREAFLRKKIQSLETRQAQTAASLAEATQALDARNALTARQMKENQALRKSLAEVSAVRDSQTALVARQSEENLALRKALGDQKAWAAQQEEENQSLRDLLSEKEAALAALSAPKPKLYLPDEEAPRPEEPIVYYNENTGIYHADRFCAPYQAIEAPLSQVPPRARPCKKCAEGALPIFPPPVGSSEPENQLSLFDGPDIQ